MAAMLGIQAARAAQRGYRAEERILEMKLGFFEAFGGVDGSGGAARRDPWTSARPGTSSPTWRSSWCPAAIRTTRSAEAAANAAREGKIAAAEVDEHHRVAPWHDRADRPAASRAT